MGQHAAKLVLAVAASAHGGCSLIYNPGNLPAAADAQPDAAIDGNPCSLALTDVFPPILVEGTGDGGSRPAVLVIAGSDIVKSDISVAIAPAAGESRTPMITIDNDKLEVDDTSSFLAVPVTLPVDPALPAGQVIPLDITVTQSCAQGPVTVPLSGKLTLKGLDEMIGAAPSAGFPLGVNEYSKIEITGGTIKSSQSVMTDDIIILRSTSSASITGTGTISVSAAGINGGPGGGDGGKGGALLGNPGAPGTGPSPGQPSGGGGKFTGDSGLSTMSGKNRGSGGAGADGSVLGSGGDGGGGGGSIEISAAGNLTIGNNIAARGAIGTGSGTAAGGGGSGGTILVRAGNMLDVKALDVGGGAGNGEAGRARYDGAMVTIPPGATGADHYRGPSFSNPPLITRSARPQLTIVGKALTGFSYFILGPSGGDVKGPFNATNGNGTTTITPPEELERGYNQLCLLVEGANPTSDTRTCIDIAYLHDH